jgi:glycine oxidase
VKGQIVELEHELQDTPNVWGPGGVYVVPQLRCESTGRARVLVGATVQRVGFDKSTSTASTQTLVARASALLPALRHAPVTSTWAGLRPGSIDDMPFIGASSTGVFIASGHHRNGVLLAAATARLLADLITKRPSGTVDVAAFSPLRQSASPTATSMTAPRMNHGNRQEV